MSLGEIVLLLLVGIIVVGPRNLPTMMRTAGQWVARLRRMSTELRSQSGIDDLLRSEGLDQHLHELRSLSRLNVVDTLMAGAAASPPAARPMSYTVPGLPSTAKALEWKRSEPLREREYPLVGCDAYGALADDAAPYAPTTPTPPPAEAAPADAVAETAAAEPAPEPPADALPAAPTDVAAAPAAIEAPT